MLAAAAAVLTITVRVYDLNGVPPEQRTKALALAADTLARANVSANWIDCTRPNDRPPQPACQAVLKRGEMVLRFQDRTDRGPHILGTAIVQDSGPNVLASVYAESAAERSAKTGLPLWIILGRVTAHEIGHLLLGTNSHTPTGLMQAQWDLRRQHLADWHFTTADAVKIRSRMLPPADAEVATADE